MAEHIDRNNPRDHARESNSQIHTSRSNKTNLRPFDDVIASLANATENRRARQVSEWEGMRRQVFPSVG
ncbi:MAG: hypothetical protein IPG58_08560 [Acidobacteria bacterium]|nr:hypothetical protein [Acidobacteriota bacterium]